MCGILGINNISELSGTEITALVTQNKLRGKASEVKFTTPQGTFFHFRAPTSGCNLNNLSEAYPLTYKGWGLIGNGVINESYFKKIKDEDNNNDLYYILKGIVEKGFKFLEEVEGVFALVIFNTEGEIFLIKNTFPLYFTPNIFSSVEFENSTLLADGVIVNWSENSTYGSLKLKESPFLI